MLGGSNRLMGTRETAEYLGVPIATLYGEWRKWGLKGYRVGRALKFRVRDVECWIERRAA